MPDPLPWSEQLRRRNGLPPRPADDMQLLRSLGLDRSAQPLDAEQPPDLTVTVTADTTAAKAALRRLAAAFDLRCLHDLLPAMCHHCKETDRG
ncbi:hypothetical protein [Streptacidiphilus sp. EB103A]|uniref:hypothetical protein n=1 Tax=Streptacidiphilus sp. EB103A TaxID=3156275 RepID=UPI0035117DB6